jgi:hypothetical protein
MAQPPKGMDATAERPPDRNAGRCQAAAIVEHFACGVSSLVNTGLDS